MVKSAYIHIPFCKSKCHYCSFVSFPVLERKGQYIHKLQQQILKEYNGETLDTLYFGGGTPSLLTSGQINEFINLFNLNDNAEVTLELNPETVDAEYFQNLSKTRVNRLSIGSQSFDDKILKKIGRRHKSADVFRVVEEARAAGFENISLDFIYGLPEQSLESFVSDLKTAVSLGVEHISLYGLKIENGFEHYEISNFCRDGKFSRHNVNYWKNQEYYGLGLAAHGYVDGVRYSNQANLDLYCSHTDGKDFQQELSPSEILEEEIFLGLRLTQGINVHQINQKFGIDFEKKYANILRKYYGYLENKNGMCRFTKEGFLISNYILADFIDD